MKKNRKPLTVRVFKGTVTVNHKQSGTGSGTTHKAVNGKYNKVDATLDAIPDATPGTDLQLLQFLFIPILPGNRLLQQKKVCS